MQNFDIIDNSDVGDDEERQVAARRMFMYSPKALQAADEVKRKYVIFRDLKEVLTAYDRAYQLALRIRQPQGVLVIGPPGRRRPVSPSTSAGACPPRLTSFEGYSTWPSDYGRTRVPAPSCRSCSAQFAIRSLRSARTL